MKAAIADDDKIVIEYRCYPVVEVFPLSAAYRRDQQHILAVDSLSEGSGQWHQLDGERFFEASRGLFHDLDGDTAGFTMGGLNDVRGSSAATSTIAWAPVFTSNNSRVKKGRQRARIKVVSQSRICRV